MQILHTILNCPLAYADTIRREFLKHPHSEVEKDKFIENAKNKSLKETQNFYKQVKNASTYAFNKSHAASYAVMAYRSAYLKCHYKKEYEAAMAELKGSKMKIINTKNADVIFTDNNKLLIGLKYKNTTPEFEVMFCNNDFQAFKKIMVFCDAPIIVEPETGNELYEYCLKNCNFETEPVELYSVVEKHIYDMSLNSEQNTLPYKNCINIEKMIIEKLGKSAMPDEMVKNYEEWNVINNGREVLKNNLEKEIKRLELAQKFIFDSCPSWYPEEMDNCFR